MLSRHSMKRCWQVLLAGIAILSPALPTLGGPLVPFGRTLPAAAARGPTGSQGDSPSTWGVSVFAQMGNNRAPGGSGYLYRICDTTVFLDANKVPRYCSLFTSPYAPYRATSSIEIEYNDAATVCPGEFDSCSARTKLVSSEGLFTITEDVAVRPSEQPSNPQNYNTYDFLVIALASEDVMHVNSRRLPIGTPVVLETTFTEHGSERVVCGGALNDTPYGGEYANSFYYISSLQFAGYNRTLNLTGKCVGDQWSTKPTVSDGGPYHEGFSASSKLLVHVGDALLFGSYLYTQAEANDCAYTSPICGELVYSFDSAKDFTVTTQFRPVTPNVSLSFDSGASYQ